MADKPVAEVVDVDAVIDALSPSPTSSDVYEATLPFNPHAVAASAVRRAGEGGGGGGGSLPQTVQILGPFTVAFDTPNLTSSYVVLYTAVAETLVFSAMGRITIDWAGPDPAPFEVTSEPTIANALLWSTGDLRLTPSGRTFPQWPTTGAQTNPYLLPVGGQVGCDAYGVAGLTAGEADVFLLAATMV